MPVATAAIRTARRVDRFTYAIRNIVAEARKVEAAGTRVRYLNIGDPNQFGFLTPPHLIEAVARAMRDGHNGYTASAGIVEAREAVAADFEARGVAVDPDRVLITSGTSEGLELALTAIVDDGEAVLVPSPTYPLPTGIVLPVAQAPEQRFLGR
jgi:alanine-synthesizing transaminase